MLSEEELHTRFPWTAGLAFNTTMVKKDVDEKSVPDKVVLIGTKTEKGEEKIHRFNLGNNLGEIMPNLLFNKLKVIESGRTFGNALSAPPRIPTNH